MADISALTRVRHELSKELTRIVWGNDAWAVNNRGQARLIRGLRSTACAVDSAAAAISSHIDDYGYAVLDNAFDAALMAEIYAGYLAVIDNPDLTLDMGCRIPELVRYVREPHEHVPGLRRLVTPRVRAVLDAYYGGHWRLDNVRMWRIGHIPPREQGRHHYGNIWHCDQHPTSALKLFVQIDLVANSGDSAFRFHDVPSTQRIMRTGFFGTGHVIGPAAREIECPERVIRFDGRPGTAAFCNTTRCLHRAGIPDPGTTRGMVQLFFMPNDGPAAADPFAALPPDPGVQPGRAA